MVRKNTNRVTKLPLLDMFLKSCRVKKVILLSVIDVPYIGKPYDQCLQTEFERSNKVKDGVRALLKGGSFTPTPF